VGLTQIACSKPSGSRLRDALLPLSIGKPRRGGRKRKKHPRERRLWLPLLVVVLQLQRTLNKKKEIWLEGWRFVQAIPCCGYLVWVFFTPEGDYKYATDKEAIPFAASPVTIVPPHPAAPKVTDSGFSRPPGLDVSDREVESDEDDGGDIDAVG
jgi:hypothetical protein